MIDFFVYETSFSCLIIQVPKTSGELHAIYLIISQFKRKTKLKYKQHAPTLFPEDGYLKKCFFQ
jgi:hypothetical protein